MADARRAANRYDGGMGEIHWGALVAIFAAALGSMALTFYRPHFRDRRRRLRLERTPVHSIRNATVGSVVKIAGKVEAVEPLIEAPLSARSGVAYVARADLIYSPQRGMRAAAAYRGEKRAQDFLVRDATGVALVRVAGADIIAEPPIIDCADDRKSRWLRRRHGHARFLGLVRRELRFFETVLVPGAEVVVLGRCAASSPIDGDGPYRDGGEPSITLDGRVLLCWPTASASASDLSAEPLFRP
jgi:hypothetical protein